MKSTGTFLPALQLAHLPVLNASIHYSNRSQHGVCTRASWRIFWITMLNRTDPEASPNDAFTQLDQYLLDELLPHKAAASPKPSLAHYIVKLARLGGYLARAHDPPPGNTVIWRGLSRLSDIELGIMIGVQLVGN